MAELIKHHETCGKGSPLGTGGKGTRAYTVLVMGGKRAIQCNSCGAWIVVEVKDLGETLEQNLQN